MVTAMGQDQSAERSLKEYSTYDYVPLIKSVMAQQKVRQAELAKESGIKQCTLSRYLNGDCAMSLGVVFHIAAVLNIDLLRAYIAVFIYRDWRLYYDERLITATDFHEAVVEESMKLSHLSVPSTEIKLLAVQSVKSLAERKRFAAEYRTTEPRGPFGARLDRTAGLSSALGGS